MNRRINYNNLFICDYSQIEHVQYVVVMPENILGIAEPVATDAKPLKYTSANYHGSQGRYSVQSFQQLHC